MMAGVTDSEDSAGGGGSILTRKTGPLANWIWMAILLLFALVYSLWKRNSAAPAEVEDGPEVEDVPDNQTPPPVFILPQNPQPSVIINNTTPPSAPPVGTRPPTPPVVKPKPGPPAKPAVAYDTVKVTTYTDKNPAWNSTLWGIAKHAGYGSGKNNWASIWNDPKNAAIKKKRGKPENVQPGDTLYVRRK